MHEDIERWRRLTILDILCYFPAFALAAATVHGLAESQTFQLFDAAQLHVICPENDPKPPFGYSRMPRNPQSELKDATLPELLFYSLVLGGVYAAPLTLSVQFLIRKRRQGLDFWEWLWLEPIILFAVTAIISGFERPTPFCFFLFVSVQIFCSAIALIMLLCRLCDFKRRIPFCWTDFFGGTSCFLVGVMIIHLLSWSLS